MAGQQRSVYLGTQPSIMVPPGDQVLWGAVANAFTQRPGWPAQGPDAHREYEDQTGRLVGVYAAYYRGDTGLWPKASEIALSREVGSERVLYMHWRLSHDITWADAIDNATINSRIDAQCDYLLANYTERFFLGIHSEPESYVRFSGATGGQGTPAEYAALYRYVRDRFEANGVTNVVWVMALMGYPKWGSQTWFTDLYPGDDYVDWIGWDPYSTTGSAYVDFSGLMNITWDSVDPAYTGFYSTYCEGIWSHKPFMLSEWGVFHTTGTLTKKADFYASVSAQLSSFPKIKMMVKFDTDNDLYGGGGDIGCFTDSGNLAAFVTLSQDARFVNPALIT